MPVVRLVGGEVDFPEQLLLCKALVVAGARVDAVGASSRTACVSALSKLCADAVGAWARSNAVETIPAAAWMGFNRIIGVFGGNFPWVDVVLWIGDARDKTASSRRCTEHPKGLGKLKRGSKNATATNGSSPACKPPAGTCGHTVGGGSC